jgi:oligopeptide/dipeptide ABC transporter ATP-binding protein
MTADIGTAPHADAHPTPPPLVLEVTDLVKHYEIERPLLGRLTDRLAGRSAPTVQAVNGVSLTIRRGQTLGVIGESGCGKTSLGRTVLRLQEPTSGSIRVVGTEVTTLGHDELTRFRRRMQIIFQDPYASLNPRKTIEEIVGLPLVLHEGIGRREARDRVAAFLAHVGLKPAHMRRYPHQFSGGQRQRIGIARALILKPDFVVCDEPVSALDVSIQAQVIELLQALKAEMGLTYLFISHDLAVVGYLADHIAVMYLGEVVEAGPRAAIVEQPRHPYTQALLSAVPHVHRGSVGRVRLTGDLPSPIDPPPGCRFHTRCPLAGPRCRRDRPETVTVAPGHDVRCHLVTGGTA